MLDCWKQSCRFTVAFAATWFGLLIAIDTNAGTGAYYGEGGFRKGVAIGCLPPSPSPCVADGTCHPNQREWGYNRTRWRPWPGDQLVQEPTPAEEREADEQMQLEPFERPPAVKEDIRGPSKTKSDESSDKIDTEEVPQVLLEAEPFVPEANPLPDLDDLQGSLRNGQQQEDAPPALPQSLRKISLLRQGKPVAMRQAVVQASATTQEKLIRLPSTQDAPPVFQQATPQERNVEIVPAERQENPLPLVNPAATNIGKHF